MKKRRLISMAVLLCLVLTLVVPGAIIAAGGGKQAAPDATNIEIVKKVGAKGVPFLMGPPSRGPKPHAAKGILGEACTGDRYAIIIGISDYPGEEYDLFYADEDAVAMATLLAAPPEQGGYGFTNISLLVDSEEGPPTDPAPTRGDIMDTIAAVKVAADASDDEVVFFFSGHSVKGTPKPTPAQGGGKIGILTWGEDPLLGGFGYIWDEELREAFKGFETDRIVFIFDCCLAGGMIDLGAKSRVVCMATTQTGIAAEYGDEYADFYDFEPPTFPINHGLFTFSLLAGMLPPDFAADFYDHDVNSETPDVTVEEAFDFARFYLEGMSLATPEFWQIPTISDRFHKDLLL